MADRHKHAPVPVRLPESDRVWLKEHARRTGQAVNAIIAALVDEYRQRQESGDPRLRR